jgi:hypothetical protein
MRGAGEKIAAVDNSELTRLRDMETLRTLALLAEHVGVDKDFKPIKSRATRRVHVSAAGAEWELLVNGPKFYDTRAGTGGGGAIDLVMYLWGVPFKTAVAMLRRAGA